MSEDTWGDDDIVDMMEGAKRLHLTHGTLTQYRWASMHNTDHRHNVGLPDPDLDVPGKPLWRWATLRDWAQRTGRGRYAPSRHTD